MSPHNPKPTLIGSNFKIQPKNNTPQKTTPPPTPMCTSKICTVHKPHAAKPYTRTTSDLPYIIKTMEAKTQTAYDNRVMDIFYTVHWDHANRPLPPPIQECVSKDCPVDARHEAKVFSQNPKKAHLLPVKVQQVQAKEHKTKGEVRGLAAFWREHGPSE